MQQLHLSHSVYVVLHSIIVDRIDVDKDGYVTEKELQDWVGHVGKRYAHWL